MSTILFRETSCFLCLTWPWVELLRVCADGQTKYMKRLCLSFKDWIWQRLCICSRRKEFQGNWMGQHYFIWFYYSTFEHETIWTLFTNFTISQMVWQKSDRQMNEWVVSSNFYHYTTAISFLHSKALQLLFSFQFQFNIKACRSALLWRGCFMEASTCCTIRSVAVTRTKCCCNSVRNVWTMPMTLIKSNTWIPAQPWHVDAELF